MKNNFIRYFVIAVLISLLIAIWFQRQKTSKEHSAIGIATNENANPQTMVSTTSSIPDSSPNSTTQGRAVGNQYNGQTVQDLDADRNSKSQDFYGKVADQDGQPIADVFVAGVLIIETNGGFTTESFDTQTDPDGLFQFVGLRGADLNVKIKKDGYEMGMHGEGFKGPVGASSSPSDRATLTMWKIHGAEPLIGSSIDAKIAHDGTSTTFDIMTGTESPNGELRVSLFRSPLEVRRGKDIFDWTIKIEMLHGGLLEQNDPYPYWAPESGYQSSFEFNMSSNDVSWSSSLEKNFYIKNSQGQYGRMKFDAYSALTPAKIQVGFTVNPSGSQNLEPDFSK